MAHNKMRSRVDVGEVDWSTPRLNELLQKVDGWSIDHRNQFTPQPVQIRIACGCDTSPAVKPAWLVANMNGILVLSTPFPLPLGGDVQVIGLPGTGPAVRWAVVTDEREGARAEDRGQGVFLNWLRPR